MGGDASSSCPHVGPHVTVARLSVLWVPEEDHWLLSPMEMIGTLAGHLLPPVADRGTQSVLRNRCSSVALWPPGPSREYGCGFTASPITSSLPDTQSPRLLKWRKGKELLYCFFWKILTPSNSMLYKEFNHRQENFFFRIF